MIHSLLKKIDQKVSFQNVKAHCDVPCGVYDPVPTQIAAMTVARMTDTLNDLEAHEKNDHKGERALAYQNTASRMIQEKERSAELVKHEIRIIWGDFLKPNHFTEHPQLHEITHSIMSLASKCKQNVDVEASRALVEKVNAFAEAFWKIKGISSTKVKYHCKPNLEIVFPQL